MTEDRLSVLGTAVGELAPDRVQWKLTVHEADAEPAAAFERCSARLGALAAALADSEVVTDKVTVYEEWHTNGNKKTGRTVASGTLTATSPIDRAGALAATAMHAGADSLHGPRALYPDATATRDALSAQAVTNARATARLMAGAAGRTLGRVVSLRDPRGDERGEPYIEDLRAGGAGGQDDGPPILTRPQRHSVAVAVVFELLD